MRTVPTAESRARLINGLPRLGTVADGGNRETGSAGKRLACTGLSPVSTFVFSCHELPALVPLVTVLNSIAKEGKKADVNCHSNPNSPIPPPRRCLGERPVSLRSLRRARGWHRGVGWGQSQSLTTAFKNVTIVTCGAALATAKETYLFLSCNSNWACPIFFENIKTNIVGSPGIIKMRNELSL